PNSPRSALEVWLARIPRRLGYARSWRNAFLTHTVPARPGHVRMRKRAPGEIKRLLDTPIPTPPPASAHQIHEYLHLAAALGANPAPLSPQLHVPPHFYPTLTARFGLPPGSRPLFGLNAGAEYGPAKRWPTERFLAAAVELQQRTHCQWLIFGGPSDTQLAGDIATGIQRQIAAVPGSASFEPPLNLAGQTTLRELMALLKLCRVLLTNDTGPMHVAAALDTPVVALFGSTSPELTGPGLPGDPRHRLLKAQVPCAPCFLRTCPIDFRCMQSLTVEQVVETVLQLSGELHRAV
ncbi:MAG TPA: lipopolysaccharide heptosyltransferase II, partial [Candidatus Sulfotelmatobacter sp.]|nr:lipopolysaccharide heptosyltransferase II [Candidatus Sulfotelmatobacter sp.]